MPKFHAAMDDAELKRSGVIKQRDGKYCLRLEITGGRMSAQVLKEAAGIAERFGTGEVHGTTRQGIEIPHVPAEKIDDMAEALEAANLRTAPGGPHLRSIVACPGVSWCRFGMIDGQNLAQEIAAHTADCPALPHKFKIAIAGCPNGCAKPVENDFGLLGVGRGRCAVLVGGRMGKLPRLADRLPGEIPATPEAVLLVLDAVLEWFRAHGEAGERCGAVLDRLGVDSLERAVEKACAGVIEF